LLLGAVTMLANMQERLEANSLSVHKLKKLLGMVRSSEKLRDLLPGDDDKPSSESNSAEKESRAEAASDRKKSLATRRKRRLCENPRFTTIL